MVERSFCPQCDKEIILVNGANCFICGTEYQKIEREPVNFEEGMESRRNKQLKDAKETGRRIIYPVPSDNYCVGGDGFGGN